MEAIRREKTVSLCGLQHAILVQVRAFGTPDPGIRALCLLQLKNALLNGLLHRDVHDGPAVTSRKIAAGAGRQNMRS